MHTFHCIGLMSGTSLDGVDLVFCRLNESKGQWKYTLLKATTIPYSTEWEDRLRELADDHGMSLLATNLAYGHYLGKLVGEFASDLSPVPDFVSSHGHTVFHQPHLGYTLQIGYGPAISAACGLPVVCNFRTQDVVLGGQGAPLVPVGDRLLFGEYKACVNLGGFANLSYEVTENRVAFDICPVNIVLNELSKRLGFNFDENGKLAASGKLIPDLLNQLNALPYYQLPPPKSLGREWVEEFISPLLLTDHPAVDLLRTMAEHAAIQISSSLEHLSGQALFTGGGTNNSFLMERITALSDLEIVIPDQDLVDYKEGLVFALLGALRISGQNNCLASVTGASHDHSSGVVFGL